MLFWCAHPSSVSAWDSLHRREQNYIATCMATPPQWELALKVTFAKARVAQLWQDASVVMAQLVSSSGGHASSTAVTQ
jgi:hypothetical protein